MNLKGQIKKQSEVMQLTVISDKIGKPTSANHHFPAKELIIHHLSIPLPLNSIESQRLLVLIN